MNMKDIKIGVYARQNMIDERNFSCGLHISTDGKKITLIRYNGPSHLHNDIQYKCHIHNSTATSIKSGMRKPENADVKQTDRYTELNGAMKCLMDDYNITDSTSENVLFSEWS